MEITTSSSTKHRDITLYLCFEDETPEKEGVMLEYEKLSKTKLIAIRSQAWTGHKVPMVTINMICSRGLGENLKYEAAD